MSVARESGPARMFVTGEIDASNAPDLWRSIIAAAGEQRSPLDIDLAGVTFMDSTGLRAIEDAAYALAAGGYRVVLWNLPREVRRIADIVGIGDDAEVSR